MKKEFANIVDHLARNSEVMFQLNNHAYSSELIPEAVHITVQSTNSSSPYERANKLVSSLLSTLEGHPNPDVVFSCLINSFKKVGLSAAANRLTGNLSKIIALMHFYYINCHVETPQLHSNTHHQMTIKDSHQSKVVYSPYLNDKVVTTSWQLHKVVATW